MPTNPATASQAIDTLPLLQGKRVLITGAASGIGLGTARALIAFGADVFVSDLDMEALLGSWPDLAADRVHRLDVVDERECEACIDHAVETLGGLDGVFHSAGVSDAVMPAVEIDVDDWQRIVDINLRGTFLVARAAGRHMLRKGAGSIALVSSVNGIAGIPRRHAYGPAKAAIAQLARTLACEWGDAGVRVNALERDEITLTHIRSC